jgi:plastocyanin
VRAKVTDQVLDDGVDYLTARARYVVTGGPTQVGVSITAGGFVPPNSNISAGTSILFTNTSGGPQTVTSTTAPYGYDVTIPNGGTYTHYLVAPGAYGFTSTIGGFNGSATVGGSAATVNGPRPACSSTASRCPTPWPAWAASWCTSSSSRTGPAT